MNADLNIFDITETGIKTLKIQGATNIAISILDAIEKFIITSKGLTNWQKIAEKEAMKLAYARPNEPLSQNSLRYIFKEKGEDRKHYLGKIADYRKFMNESKKRIAVHAMKLIKSGCSYLTHCHSSSVTDVFIKARETGLDFSVIATETRPLFQGRITAKELSEAGIKTTLIVDSLATGLLSNHEKKFDSVFVGSDLITDTGFLNKVGTKGIVQTAISQNIQAYCVSTLLKYDSSQSVPPEIEIRNELEVWPEKPRHLKILNPAFEYIPFFKEKGVKLICEQGIINTQLIKDSVNKAYPFLTTGTKK